jgi:hypothetical protein
MTEQIARHMTNLVVYYVIMIIILTVITFQQPLAEPSDYLSFCLSIQTMDEPSYSNLRATAGSLPDKKSKTYIQLLDKAN